MKKLCQTAGIAPGADGIQKQPGSFHKAGGRRVVSGQAETSKCLSEGSDAFQIAETVLWIAGTQIHVLAQIGQLKMKGGIVGQDACRIVVQTEPVFRVFQCDRAFPVCNMPVQRGQGKFIAERNPNQMGGAKKTPRFFYRIALSQDPVDQFERGDICLTRVFGRGIIGAVRKIECSHTEPFFICRFCIEGIIVCNGCHADHGIMSS